jgi:miniconductance mechanosensitive channel
MERYAHWIYDYLIERDWSSPSARLVNMIGLLVILLIGLGIVDVLIRRIILSQFARISEKTKTQFDDILVQNRVPRNVAHIIPLLIAIGFVPYILLDYPYYEVILEKALKGLSILLAVWIIRGLVHSVRDYLNTKDRFKDKPINSYGQVIVIITWIMGLLTLFAVVTGIPFFQFITTLGAASAIILLVFRDTIMGFVASIQVSVNDMVHIGDWITFEKFGADGTVIEINLATVKVQNFDKTITTIPTYALISDSFKNWRGMEGSGGRRIKRAVIIRQGSIKYLDKEKVQQLKKIQLIKDYLENRENDINTFNEANNIDKELLINGRNLTNIGVFRKFVETYIERHSAINKDMIIMTRQLAPTTQGIPIEIYAFSKDKRWQNYEYIMADIFDYIIASTPYFDLEIFELPTRLSEDVN